MAEAGLGDDGVRDLLGRLNTLLAGLEDAQGPVADLARQAVGALTEVYGTALARVMALAASAPPVTSALAADELVAHLLVLHGVHPWPTEQRVRQALDEVRPYVQSRGGDVTLTGIEDGVAMVSVSGGCQCGSPDATLGEAVTGVVLAAAPELRRVESAPGRQPAALIPAAALLRKPDRLTPVAGGT
jgi:Fe-S cluster biogenesis protein NfuA